MTRSGSMMVATGADAYGYNDRDELISSATGGATQYAYQYDDIGNRRTSFDLGTNRTYVANSLNQYTQISNLCDSASLREEFLPLFDFDGNQTNVLTSTGIWNVSYNGENRPVLWTCGTTNITMKYDRMGRRVEYVETDGAVTNKHWKFVYNGYLCLQRLNGATNAITDIFEWDPTEPVATRPLYWQTRDGAAKHYFYLHDGNKNVAKVVSYQRATGVVASYDYAPFGAVTSATGSRASVNPFRFSSEFHDDTLGLVYYNYRHYEPITGRWLRRDPALEIATRSHNNLSRLIRRIGSTIMEQSESSYYSFWQDYIFVDNKFQHTDVLGLLGRYDPPPQYVEIPFPPCCPSQRATCNSICSMYKNFSKALCDLNFLVKFRCRCVCRWDLKISASTGFPGYVRDFDCTYMNATGKTRTIGYYSQPTWFKCPAYIELGCP